ncbi:MAG: gamma-glutamyltransferase family protein [Verrucomicrobiaceae bacterium]|nr:gamma-glutamyltransferase family protein [Verrucomicrobiaceae bacterium]
MNHLPSLSRRRFLMQTGGMLAASSWVRAELRTPSELGYVVGEPVVEGIGAKILADGGNAVDALIATALAGAITQPHQTGIGGYATHGMFAMDGGRRIAALDANTVAPAAFTKDIFKPDDKGQVPDRKNHHGWLATGVPGVIAGLKLALDEFGTMPFAEVLRPAIQLARDGFPVPASLAAAITRLKTSFEKDAGSARLYLPRGIAPVAGSFFKNPELAEVLATLAKANSIEPFYRGDIAQRIAEGFAKNGGLVTKDDLAAYHARLVEPLKLSWGEHTIHTPPLLCGGITVLQMLAILKALKWDTIADGRQRLVLRVEAMRLAWRDRLALLGDPEFGPVPHERLLSEDYAAECAEKILAAVKTGKILEPDFNTTTQGGTLSFSACDKHGNIAALTLTHGDGFGAHVTVDGLGLTLGHGMSRFDPRPDHPNAPGPRKRPLHNMVPVLITKGTQPVVAIGGRGGRRIPNAMLEFLTQHIIRSRPFGESLASPRLHTEGGKAVEHQKEWPKASIDALSKAGYAVKPGGSATLSGVAMEKGQWLAGMR